MRKLELDVLSRSDRTRQDLELLYSYLYRILVDLKNLDYQQFERLDVVRSHVLSCIDDVAGVLKAWESEDA